MEPLETAPSPRLDFSLAIHNSCPRPPCRTDKLRRGLRMNQDHLGRRAMVYILHLVLRLTSGSPGFNSLYLLLRVCAYPLRQCVPRTMQETRHRLCTTNVGKNPLGNVATLADRGNQVLAVAALFLILTWPTVSLRCYVRGIMMKTWVTMAALCLYVRKNLRLKSFGVALVDNLGPLHYLSCSSNGRSRTWNGQISSGSDRRGCENCAMQHEDSNHFRRLLKEAVTTTLTSAWSDLESHYANSYNCPQVRDCSPPASAR